MGKKKTMQESNVVYDIMNLTIVVSKVNLMESNPKELWIELVLPVIYTLTRRRSPTLNHLKPRKGVHGELGEFWDQMQKKK